MHEQPENFEPEPMESEAKENPALMPLANKRDEAEIQMHVREARHDKDALQNLVKESEEIIKRGRGPSSMSARDKEIILKHERRIALAESVLNGTYEEQLQKDEAREVKRKELLAEVKKTHGLDALRELAETYLGAWDVGLSVRMILFAPDERARKGYTANIDAAIYEMENNPDTDPLKLLEKKYQLAYARDFLERKKE